MNDPNCVLRVATLLLAAMTLPASAQNAVYYLDDAGPYFASQISKLDIASQTVIEIGQVETRLAGLVFAPDGRFFGISRPRTSDVPVETIPTLFELDSKDASIVREIPTTLDIGFLGFIIDLHFDRLGRLWVVHGNNNTIPVPLPLVVTQIDPESGEVLLQSTLDLGIDFVAVAEDELGIFVLGPDDVNRIQRIDFETGAVGPTTPLDPFLGLRNFGGDTDAQGRLLFFLDVFYIESAAGIEGSNLVAIDPSDGIVVPVFEELAFSGTSPAVQPALRRSLDVPAIDSIGLIVLAIGLLALGVARLRQHPTLDSR